MDKLRAMEVFLAAADAGNFSAAADALEISAVMVGKYIRQLEAHLNVRLIHRTTRRQGLTEVGAAFYEQCKAALEQIRVAEATVQALTVVPQGTLRVSAPVTLGAWVVAPVVADYLAHYPLVKIELVLNNAYVDLIGDGYDAAFRVSESVDADLVAKPLQPYRMTICAAPSYLREHGTPSTPADLARHRCLGHLGWPHGAAWMLSDEGKNTPWPITGSLVSNDGHALRAAALGGAGLLLQPAVLVADDIAAGRLVPILKRFAPAPRPVHLVYLPDARPRPKLRSFVEFVEARLAAPIVRAG
ncbi:LysR family transcriptional regulator [Trinickia caryophylli]|uniref:DNA-binding transcriptional regulator, LysR family n=1 Tax=Trinickia caryophylli TaxID=28094 RepID=A0A1X7H251_TRICW|nr:LysR family transcriptional regulator [Trinickia caryophylli]PMS10032.1 LysR family transcriptional regulator [Trinickia caryophylli]TRX18388.1 LysR family transcriptional regulator [Trinickia caryophylli]WQE10828.1 LysR family transcriptional regulator [Trinickia caryophylli]SMF78509.1 DNA-binding transcriptional regulator, LysR family [Trinickia caryophylli]GLU35468.1 LysR family transcriptional regulator [Trinickia caryophylli]